MGRKLPGFDSAEKKTEEKMTEGWFKLGSGSCQREKTEVMRQAKDFSRHNQAIDAYNVGICTKYILLYLQTVHVYFLQRETLKLFL